MTQLKQRSIHVDARCDASTRYRVRELLPEITGVQSDVATNRHRTATVGDRRGEVSQRELLLLPEREGASITPPALRRLFVRWSNFLEANERRNLTLAPPPGRNTPTGIHGPRRGNRTRQET